MLQLIVPPIVVVIALVFLVVLVYRKRSVVLEAPVHINTAIEKDAGSRRIDIGVDTQQKRTMLGAIGRVVLLVVLRAVNTVARWFKDSSARVHRSTTRLMYGSGLVRGGMNEDKKDLFSGDSAQGVDMTKQTSGHLQRMKILRNSLVKSKDFLHNEEQRVDTIKHRSTVSAVMTHPDSSKEAGAEKTQFEQALIERIALDPRDIEAYERLGDYYMEQKSYNDAKECYKQVLRLSPVHRKGKMRMRQIERVLGAKIK